MCEYPPVSRGKIVVWGLMASYPFGGMTWQVLHYLAGLRRLGFDVWYVEDSDRYVYDPVTYCRTANYSANVRFLARQMEHIGLGDRWMFRPPESMGTVLGLAGGMDGLKTLYREAEAALNLCGAQEFRPDHETIRCRVFIETDPVASQVKVAKGDLQVVEELNSHHHLFTYGENFGAPDCRVPLERYNWHPTRPPVCVDWWKTSAPPVTGAPFTTVANWRHSGNDVVWKGETWRWSKDQEFRRFICLPWRSPVPLEMSVGAIGEDDEAQLRSHGWRINSADLADPVAYHDYICTSLGEFTVAKEQYVRPRSGWFSDRSVCYLAAGRPVITQRTGFEKFIPTGEGLFSFDTEDEVLDAIESISGNYARHSAAASAIAWEYFGAERVLRDLARTIGLI